MTKGKNLSKLKYLFKHKQEIMITYNDDLHKIQYAGI